MSNILDEIMQKYKRACVCADGTLIIIGAHTANNIKKSVEDCVEGVQQLLLPIGLNLNVEKIEVLLRNMLPPRIRAELPEIIFNLLGNHIRPITVWRHLEALLH